MTTAQSATSFKQSLIDPVGDHLWPTKDLGTEASLRGNEVAEIQWPSSEANYESSHCPTLQMQQTSVLYTKSKTSSNRLHQQSARLSRRHGHKGHLKATNTRLPPQLASTLGAVHTNTFHEHGIEKSGQIVRYLVDTMGPKLFHSDKERRIGDWVSLFCQEPVVYHALYHSMAIHRDVLSGQVSRARRVDVLASKGKALHLINEQLKNFNITDGGIESLLAAMLVLGVHDLEDGQLHMTSSFAFEAYLPQENWHSVYGKFDIVEEHVRAVTRLVQLIGGVHKLNLPGIALMIVHSNILVASMTQSRPLLAHDVPPDPEVLASHRMLRTTYGQSPGKGFFKDMSIFPPNTLSVFVRLATVDCYMAANVGTKMSEMEYDRMLETRNAVHHALLSLPAADLPDTRRPQAFKSLGYEICRVTAIIYSTAILWGLPPHRGWHQKLAHNLRELLEKLEPGSEPDMIVWALCIGGLASHGSPDRNFFEERLRRLIKDKGLVAWPRIECIVADFLWSRRACGNGATMLWAAL